MVFIPTPDHDSDLWTGNEIDLDNPPQHCGAAMGVSEEGNGFRLDCMDGDYEIHTDGGGVLTEPPFITAEPW